MFLTALVDRFTTIGAFAFDRLRRAHFSIPVHTKWTAASCTVGLVDGHNRARRARELIGIHALLVFKLCSCGALWQLIDSARLDLRVEDRTIATIRLLNRNTLPILRDGVVRTAWHGDRDTAGRWDIKRGSLRASRRLDVDANAPLKLGSIRTLGTFD